MASVTRLVDDALAPKLLGIGHARCAQGSILTKILVDDGNPPASGVAAYNGLAACAERLVGLRCAWVSIADDDFPKFSSLSTLPVPAVVERRAQFLRGNETDRWRFGHELVSVSDDPGAATALRVGRTDTRCVSRLVHARHLGHRECDVRRCPRSGLRDRASARECTHGDWDEQELRLLLRLFAERRSEAASA